MEIIFQLVTEEQTRQAPKSKHVEEEVELQQHVSRNSGGIFFQEFFEE